MVDGLGAALHGQASRLVQGQDLVVLIKDQGLGIGNIAARQGLFLARIRGIRQGRHAYLTAGHQMGLSLDPRAIDADLARTGHFLDLDMVQIRPAPLEPAIQPHPVFTGIHIECANFFHANTRRAKKRPANKAATERTTEAVA